MINKKLLSSVLILLITLPLVLSLGISPGRTTIDFESNLKKTVTVTVINNEKKDFQATIYTKGDLSDHIKLSTDKIEFTEDEERKSFTYSIKLPNKLEPGLNKEDIVVRETLKEREEKELTVSALIAIVSQLHVNVPYPGKFLKIDLLIKEAKPGEKIKFFIPVINLGTEKIENAKPYIFIFDLDENRIAKIEGKERPIPSKARTEFVLDWQADTLPGFYKAIAVVEYDGNKITAENNFLIGDFFLEPIDISVKEFTLGEIAKFNILVENIGNKLIKDAFSRIILNNQEGKEIANIKSASVDIPSRKKEEMNAYWDTENIIEGEYHGKLVLSYEDKSAERRIRTIIEQDAIKTEIIGITALAIGIEKATPAEKPKYLIPLIIIILALANIGWIVYVKNRLSKTDGMK